MLFTEYFLYTRERDDRKNVKMEWIEYVFYHPIFEEIQPDGRVRKWAYIDELGKYLRIVVLEDYLTVHNAFFDRNFKQFE